MVSAAASGVKACTRGKDRGRYSGKLGHVRPSGSEAKEAYRQRSSGAGRVAGRQLLCIHVPSGCGAGLVTAGCRSVYAAAVQGAAAVHGLKAPVRHPHLNSSRGASPACGKCCSLVPRAGSVIESIHGTQGGDHFHCAASSSGRDHVQGPYCRRLYPSFRARWAFCCCPNCPIVLDMVEVLVSERVAHSVSNFQRLTVSVFLEGEATSFFIYFIFGHLDIYVFVFLSVRWSVLSRVLGYAWTVWTCSVLAVQLTCRCMAFMPWESY